MTHATHAMHENSLAAYAAASATLRGRKRLIIDLLNNCGRPMTDRGLALYCGRDVAFIQPRLSDLIDDGVLIEVERVECPITGHMVRRVWFAVAAVPQEVGA